jgi:cytochrome P450
MALTVAQAKEQSNNVGLLDLKRSLSPPEFASALRTRGDLFWNESGKFWVVTRYKIAAECMRNQNLSADRSGFFVQRMPQVDLSNLQNFFPIVSDMMVMQDGLGHKNRRKIASDAIQSYSREQLSSLMKSAIDGLLLNVIGGVGASNQMEFVSQVANVLPAAILAELFGIPTQDRNQLFDFSNRMTAFFGGASEYTNESAKDVDHCAKRMKQFFKKMIQSRRKSGLKDDDLLTRMVLSADKMGMNSEVLVSQAIMMFVAGVVTTNDQIALNLLSILKYTDAADREQASLMDWMTIVDEATRFDPAVTFTFRTATNELELDDQVIRKGETVFFAHHAINRDEEVFSRPNSFNLSRKKNRHMGFGLGSHRCVGAGPANIQMAMLFHRLFLLVPQLKLANKGAQKDHYSLSFSGCRSIPLILGGIDGVCL